MQIADNVNLKQNPPALNELPDIYFNTNIKNNQPIRQTTLSKQFHISKHYTKQRLNICTLNYNYIVGLYAFHELY